MSQYKSSSNAVVQHSHTYLHFCCILAINLYSRCQHKLAANDARYINFAQKAKKLPEKNHLNAKNTLINNFKRICNSLVSSMIYELMISE